MQVRFSDPKEAIRQSSPWPPFFRRSPAGLRPERNVSARRLSAEEITEAQSILLRAGASEELTREVLAILNSLGAKRPADGNNFKCVYDAIRIADLAEALKGQLPQAGNSATDESFLTQTGKSMMKEIVDQSSLRS